MLRLPTHHDRCVAVADKVVPEYRRSGRTYYSCTGHVAKRWQAAYEAALEVLTGVD